MPMDRRLYPRNWKKVSRTIRRIAGNRCEWCGIPNGLKRPGGSRVVLTVAHLGVEWADGRPGDTRDKHDVRRENLRALCQRCHLRYDRNEHIRVQKANRRAHLREMLRKAGQLKLMEEALS